jgi:hypothetical protein
MLGRIDLFPFLGTWPNLHPTTRGSQFHHHHWRHRPGNEFIVPDPPLTAVAVGLAIALSCRRAIILT